MVFFVGNTKTASKTTTKVVPTLNLWYYLYKLEDQFLAPSNLESTYFCNPVLIKLMTFGLLSKLL